MKRYLTGILAIVIAVSTVAFTNVEKKTISGKVEQTFWYNPALGGSPNPALAFYYQETSVACNEGQNVICTIQAEEDGSTGKPDFSSGNPVSHPGDFDITRRQ